MDINKSKYDFNDFVEIIKILRSPNGCPWDREQTHESLKSNLIEESYEFLSEIDKKNIDGMKEELGDVLLQVLMHAQIAQDDGKFDINDVIDGIAKKMVFRHPHVFGEDKAVTSDNALDLFNQQKQKEKHFDKQVDVLKSIPESYPALIKAEKTASKLNKIQPNFFKKTVEENVELLKQTVVELDNVNEETIGKILWQVVTLAKIANVDAEIALTSINKRIVEKFENVENKIIENNKKIEEIDGETFKKYWEN
ncbi:MAG: nucleoside triphosphate pyrophosphohydrolase [Clostridiales bacterium]|nr:nucleoside triphosphate pyrophosphohydrolase [Clostridiales bacterium]